MSLPENSITKSKGIFELDFSKAKMKMHCDSCDSSMDDIYSPASKCVAVTMRDKSGYHQNHSFCSAKCAVNHLSKAMDDPSGSGE